MMNIVENGSSEQIAEDGISEQKAGSAHQDHVNIDRKEREELKKEAKHNHGKSWTQVNKGQKNSIRNKITQASLQSWALAEQDPHQGCRAWCWNGSMDSVGCPLAAANDVYEILHHSRRVLGAYGSGVDDLERLIKEHEPGFNKKIVVTFQHPNIEKENCPPYFICVDGERKEVALYMRGLNLLRKEDYAALMSNRKREKEFKGGYLHEGMGKAASWCHEHVTPCLKEQLLKHEGYRLTLVGHSLGAGVTALLTAVLVENLDAVGLIDAHLIRNYAIAPPRVVSLNLSTRYSSNIYSVIYQDDFLPRISTSSVKKVFVGAFALVAGLLFLVWCKQQMKKRPASDGIYRLYPPGRVFHVVYRQPGVCHSMPIQVRVVDSVVGRFERIILTSSGTAMDHSVLKMAKHLETYNWPPELKDKI